MGGGVRHCQYHGVINRSYIRITSAGKLKRDARERERDGTDALENMQIWVGANRYSKGKDGRFHLDYYGVDASAAHSARSRIQVYWGMLYPPTPSSEATKGTSVTRYGSCASLEAEG